MDDASELLISESLVESMVMLKRWHPMDWHDLQTLHITPCYVVEANIAPFDGWFVWQVRHLGDEVPVLALQRVELAG